MTPHAFIAMPFGTKPDPDGRDIPLRNEPVRARHGEGVRRGHGVRTDPGDRRGSRRADIDTVNVDAAKPRSGPP